MELILSLMQQMCVYLVLAYMLSKTPIFLPLLNISYRPGHRICLYVLFSLFCITGTYFGLQIDDAIVNTRAIGAIMAGLFGGPVLGTAVGFTGGIHRYFMGGFTDVACAVSTTVEGLIGGLLHSYLIYRGKPKQLFSPIIVFSITLVAEIIQMALILVIADPFDEAFHLVKKIAAPMIITNSFGAALFMSILVDRKTIFEEYSAAFSRRALNVAERSVGILSEGFTPENAKKIARIVYEQTNVGAVAITDTEQILAFIGIGDDHHIPGRPISSMSTLDAIRSNRIIYLDGKEHPYQCSINQDCKLGSALIIPLRAGDRVIGAIKMYEPRRKLFSTINMSMAQGIAQLLSSQILYGEYQQKQMLLSRAEIKLLQAQINPHFLFNALNTISAVIRRHPDTARELILNLSQFFRSNLKQNVESVTLREELAHVNAYLSIEKARFSDRLTVDVDIEPSLLERKIPTFTLQPLVENAVKHGISNLLENGRIRIYSEPHPYGNKITVEDNAGAYKTKQPTDRDDHCGLGMDIVDKRLTNKFGHISELKTDVKLGCYTKMSFIIPSLGSK